MKGVITPSITEKNKVVNIARYITSNLPTEYDTEHLKNKGIKRLLGRYSEEKIQQFLNERNGGFDFHRCWYYALYREEIVFHLSIQASTIVELGDMLSHSKEIWLDSYELSVYRWCLDNYNKIFGDLE